MSLHPFFSFFGSKYQLGPLYSPPKYETIIEPFAGSAGYSLLYPDKQIHLYDKDVTIVALWKYLIEVKESEILSLPITPTGTTKPYFDKENPISAEKISDPAKMLIGFWTTESQTSPSPYIYSKNRGSNWTERKRKLIANQLHCIRHWKIEQKSYSELDNETATWYIDPPYQEAGKRYKENSIDYTHLAAWCKERSGQTIVCEQNGASWLPFSELKHVNNASNKQYKEVFWENV